MQIKYLVILLMQLGIVNNGYCQEINLFFYGQVNHHTIFKDPMIEFNVNKIDNIGSEFRIFPSWGYGIGIGSSVKVYKEFSVKIGFEYNAYSIIIKTDSANANYSRKYFADPLIEMNRSINIISIPLFLSYQWEKVSFDFGIKHSLNVNGHGEDYLLSGAHYRFDFNSNSYFFLESNYCIKVNFEVIEKLNVSFGYERKITELYDLNYLRIGLNYTFKTYKLDGK